MQESKGALVPAVVEGRDLLPSVEAGELTDAADALAKRSVAENTGRSYKSDWESWDAFCCFHGFTPLPADPEQVRLYLTQLCQYAGRKGEPVRPRTAQRHLGAIAAAHRSQDIAFDTRHPVLRRTMDGIRRTFGSRQEGAPALRHDDVITICKSFGLDVRSLRNKAIILLGFAGGFRRSELVALNVEDLDFDKGLTIILKRSKTDQEGKGRRVAIVPGADPLTCPVAAVKAWLRATRDQIQHFRACDGLTAHRRPHGESRSRFRSSQGR